MIRYYLKDKYIKLILRLKPRDGCRYMRKGHVWKGHELFQSTSNQWHLWNPLEVLKVGLHLMQPNYTSFPPWFFLNFDVVYFYIFMKYSSLNGHLTNVRYLKNKFRYYIPLSYCIITPVHVGPADGWWRSARMRLGAFGHEQSLQKILLWYLRAVLRVLI